MKTYLIAFCVSLLMVVSCSSNKEYPVKITEENGIKTISNPDYPKEGVYDLALEEKFTLGKEADNSKYIFAMPISIKLDKNNNLYVLDWDSYKFFVFNNEGKYLRSFGRKGEGPGDFDLPAYFDITGDNKLILCDARNMRICYLDSTGKYTGGTIISTPGEIRLDSRDNIYLATSAFEKGKLTNEIQEIKTTNTIKKLDTSNNQWTDIGPFAGATEMISSTMMVSGGNVFYWTITPSDGIITGLMNSYEFTFRDNTGKPTYKINRKFSPFVNPYFKEGSKKSRYLSAFTGKNIFDDKGNFWVNVNNGYEPEKYIYDIYSPDGVFQKQVFSKYLINIIKGDLAYSILRSDKELPYVKAFMYSLKKREK